MDPQPNPWTNYINKTIDFYHKDGELQKYSYQANVFLFSILQLHTSKDFRMILCDAQPQNSWDR